MRKIKFNSPNPGEVTVTVNLPVVTPDEGYLKLVENIHSAALNLVDSALTSNEWVRRKQVHYFLYGLIESCIYLNESMLASCEKRDKEIQ
jgi:hypothetical protein